MGFMQENNMIGLEILKNFFGSKNDRPERTTRGKEVI